jgi:hypothetical protein
MFGARQALTKNTEGLMNATQELDVSQKRWRVEELETGNFLSLLVFGSNESLFFGRN